MLQNVVDGASMPHRAYRIIPPAIVQPSHSCTYNSPIAADAFGSVPVPCQRQLAAVRSIACPFPSHCRIAPVRSCPIAADVFGCEPMLVVQ
jgi:hypothetical protein